ncbi:MAG: very short patch repair endonuclease [Micrococcales bacterium 70-64]|nr:very short patch repair endonuclease [Leifsonia sp.]ODU64266.1 MAG: very short patch repair endonuclease [Leifsonia sp. SCN 70-46]OJX85957.1 MAG: very short patch repair endonuclease [Micrococcales bacterium 70-64]
MESWASSPAVRKSMLGNKRRDTHAELRVRQLLHARGLRYRVDFAPLDKRRRADIVFTRLRLVIYIDGCFWHGCPLHYVRPKTNADYWLPKIERNVERDLEYSARLRDAGWTVLRFWEHEPPVEVADAISGAVAALGEERAAS